jgi:hypothetical protein
MTTTGVIDDHILEHYRALLDAEDSAFNEVEHAYEDGDRKTFEHDLLLWREALRAKLHYLERCGIDLVGTSWEPAPAST